MDNHSSQVDSKRWKAPFFFIWGGQAFSLLGSQLVQFALIWWLTKTTGSATVLATATLVGLLPQVFLGPVAGALVDRWSRRVTMIVADSLIALATLGLIGLFWTETVQIWHVYLLMFTRSALGSFHWSAMQASTSLMVPKEQLTRIQGLNQMLQGAVNIGSAPLGALLLGFLPMQAILSIDIGTALLAVIPLLLIEVPQPVPTASVASKGITSVWQDMVAGLRYVWSWPGLVMVLGMATLINFLVTPAFALLPILVTKHFSGQAIQLAYLESAWGIGVVVGGLTLSAWGGFHRKVTTSLVGLILMGVALMVVGILPSSAFWLAVFMIFIGGFTNSMVNGPMFAVFQSVIIPEMQGRVFTLILSASGAMTPLGLIIAGPLADRLGVQSWFIAGGVISALLGAGAFFVPAILKIEDDRALEGQKTSKLDVEDSSNLTICMSETYSD